MVKNSRTGIWARCVNSTTVIKQCTSKINEIVSFLKDKIEIRQGSLGNQNILIVENKGVSQCFMLTPLDLDSLCLGIANSKSPIFINSFEDSSNQYLSLFNNAWSNSKSILNDSIIQRLQKGTIDLTPEAIYKYSRGIGSA